MAVRDDFTAGEVLAAADLNDTFASKPPFAYGTAEPSTTVEGFIWYDEGDTPPTAYFWDGTEFQPFSSARAAAVTATTGSPTITTRSDGKEVYKWTGDGTVTLTEGTAALLLVAGGGSGARRTDAGPGGGGAGGAIAYQSIFLPAGTLTVTVGVGGAAQTTNTTRGNTGADSRLGNLFTIGGTGGKPSPGTGIEKGGSGGGGGGAVTGDTGLGDLSIPGQGFNGGNGVGSNSGGGGGGASEVGTAATSGVGGKGGDGITNDFETLSNQTYGGGGGGATSGATQGAGGAGGGTSAVASGASTAGTDGLGGGSGGSRGTGSGKGGNGVVILVIG